MDTDVGGVSLHLLTYKLYSNIYNHVGFVLFCFVFFLVLSLVQTKLHKALKGSLCILRSSKYRGM